MSKFVGRYFYLVVTVFSKKNRAILVPKLWGEKKLSKSVFGCLKTKKKFQWPLSSREGGGDKALIAWPLVEELFFVASLIMS